MKVAVIGYGKEGAAAYKYWTARGDEVTVHEQDSRKEIPAGVQAVTGPEYLKRLDLYDLIVRSPGVKPWLIKTTKPVTSVTKEFMSNCPARIIGVTGTKGKGTTSTLIARILGEAGWRTWLGGNIGKPPLEFLGKIRANHWVILEMSSFQLIDLDLSPHIAVCLVVAEDHLDWHRDVREYVAAKGNIFWHQHPEDLAVFDAQSEFSADIAKLSPGRRLPYLEAPGAYVKDGRIVMDGTDICGTDEVALLGPHNLENVCAAVTATWEIIKHNPEPVRRAVKAFNGLEHRLELVLEAGGVRWVDDSYSSNPVATLAAVNSFGEPKVLVLGGVDRGLSFDALARAVAGSNVRHAILVGESSARLATALTRARFAKYERLDAKPMPQVVKAAASMAERGDVVLLSPGCPSFDMFRNFEDRGEQFAAAVRALR
jgi:UDP-N-acetylmuramoylalanine--D-glutamate ligase